MRNSVSKRSFKSTFSSKLFQEVFEHDGGRLLLDDGPDALLTETKLLKIPQMMPNHAGYDEADEFKETTNQKGTNATASLSLKTGFN